jgi:ABC-type antimicrobial peptide transport system permease subunit
MRFLLQDVRHAVRLSLKSPAFTAVTLLALALGVGANTVIFSAFNAVLLRPLPYNDPERVVTVWDSFPKLGVRKIGVAYANFVDLKERARVFDPLAPRRFNLMLLSLFACAALVPAAVGVYGVLSYWVSQRTRDIGIRMALGASAADIYRLVIFQALGVVTVGLVLGVVGALGLARLLSGALPGLLFGVRAEDPATFAFVALLLAFVALVACYLPARRAVKVDPTIALRSE